MPPPSSEASRAAAAAAYGYLRKVSRATPLEGLFVEVLVLLPLALAWLCGFPGMALRARLASDGSPRKPGIRGPRRVL